MSFPRQRRSSNWGLAFGLSLLSHLLLAFSFAWLSPVTRSPQSAGGDQSRSEDQLFIVSGPVLWEKSSLPGTEESEFPGSSENLIVELTKAEVRPAPREKPVQEENPASPLANGASSAVGGSHDGGSKGGVGTTTFFGLAAPARRIVYVLDGSSSMAKNGAFDAARNHLWASVQSLPEQTQFQIILYHSSARLLLPAYSGWMSVSAETRHKVYQALADLYPEGSTKHETALPLALSLEPGVIFFLTDGDALGQQYLNSVSQKNRHGTVIHVIELHTGAGGFANPHLAQFAQDNGGQYRVFQKTGP
jgi:hypothetical protein